MSAHQVPLCISIGRNVATPELFELGEVPVQSWCVENEQPGRDLSGVAERVRDTARYKHERARPTVEDFVFDVELDHTVEHEEGLLHADVTMSRRHPGAGGNGPLHQ